MSRGGFELLGITDPVTVQAALQAVLQARARCHETVSLRQELPVALHGLVGHEDGRQAALHEIAAYLDAIDRVGLAHAFFLGVRDVGCVEHDVVDAVLQQFAVGGEAAEATLVCRVVGRFRELPVKIGA